jgi:4'-phosphopantetheinyl transferase
MNHVRTPALEKGRTHVWVLDTRELSGVAGWRERFFSTLGEAEVARAASFRFARDRILFAYSHGFLRCLLAGYTGRDPKQLVFEAGEFGKPLLADSPLHFNLSHSGSLVAAAVTESGPCGVDIEEKRNLEDLHRLIGSFSREEQNFVRGHRSGSSAFWQIWTLKESYLKAHGVGLRAELASFSVVDPAGAIRRAQRATAPEESMHFQESGAYALAACVLGSCEELFVTCHAGIEDGLVSPTHYAGAFAASAP